MWTDAKINSIERRPHEYRCQCQFFVKRYVNQGPLGSEKGTLCKDIEVVGIDKICILQKLDKNPCEDQFYRWDSSEDCSCVQRTKLFIGKFCSDISWLVVTSVMKDIAFDVRTVQNKIVYQILVCEDDCGSIKSNNYLNSVNFKVDNNILTPVVLQFAPDDASEPSCAPEVDEVDLDEPSSTYNVMNLRRSKRRNIKPDRFLGCDVSPEDDVGWVRTMPYKQEKVKEDEMFLPLSFVFGPHARASAKQTEGEIGAFSGVEPLEDIPISRFKTKPREAKSSMDKQREHQTELAIVPVPSESDLVAFEQIHSTSMTPEKYSRETNNISFGYYSTKGSSAMRRKSSFEIDDMAFERRRKGRPPIHKVQYGRYRPIPSRRNEPGEPLTYKRTTLSAGAYSKLIKSYMKNIDSTIMSKEEPHIVDQWEEFKARSRPVQSERTEPSATEDEEEDSETEMLWREMELSLASAYLLEEHEV